jgi:hypothetical protein
MSRAEWGGPTGPKHFRNWIKLLSPTSVRLAHRISCGVSSPLRPGATRQPWPRDPRRTNFSCRYPERIPRAAAMRQEVSSLVGRVQLSYSLQAIRPSHGHLERVRTFEHVRFLPFISRQIVEMRVRIEGIVRRDGNSVPLRQVINYPALWESLPIVQSTLQAAKGHPGV